MCHVLREIYLFLHIYIKTGRKRSRKPGLLWYEWWNYELHTIAYLDLMVLTRPSNINCWIKCFSFKKNFFFINSGPLGASEYINLHWQSNN